MKLDLDEFTTEEYGRYHPVTVGKVIGVLEMLAERVDSFDDGGEFAQDYVDQLKEKGVLEKE